MRPRTVASASPLNFLDRIARSLKSGGNQLSLQSGRKALRVALRRCAAGLRPELVPSVEVVKVLPTFSNPAVLELEGDAAVNIQVLAGSRPGVLKEERIKLAG